MAALLLASARGGASLAAQSSQGAAPAVRVDVGTDTVVPGNRAFLPIVLKAPETVHVGTIVQEIRFPAQWLTFQEVRTPDGATVTAAAGPVQKRDEASVVEITLTAKAGGDIPIGPVATMIFTVAKEAPVERTPIVVENAAVRASTTAEPSRVIDGATGTAGTIELTKEDPVAFGCFFYMH
jgi:hypothetical protein